MIWPFSRKKPRDTHAADAADRAVKAVTESTRQFVREFGKAQAENDLDRAIDRMCATGTHKATK